MDVVIPIVFPDYRIAVETKTFEVDLFPYSEIDNLTIPAFKERFSNLGHAGVLFINGNSGMTKYYEYGRYDAQALGLVRRIPVKNVKVNDGKIDKESLKDPLSQISRVAGQHGKIEGVYIEVKDKYQDMLNYAESRKTDNANPSRKPYDILTNSCIHFVKEITEIAGVDTPWMIDPRPNSYIGEFRDDFLDLDYAKGALHIEESSK
jgi:hypothetical protein